MNDPIISPWFFYAVGVLDAAVVALTCFLMVSIAGSLVYVVKSYPDKTLLKELSCNHYGNEAYMRLVQEECAKERENVELQEARFPKVLQRCAIIIMIPLALIIITPTPKTCYQMLVASFVTKENINLVANEAKSSIDYIVEKIIDTAARMQDVKADSKNEQKEQRK